MEKLEIKPGEDQIKSPHHIPMSIFIYEADTLYHWALEDKNALAVLGRSNRAILETIPFDMSLLDQAAQASFDLSMLLANATRDRMRPMKPKISVTWLIPG